MGCSHKWPDSSTFYHLHKILFEVLCKLMYFNCKHTFPKAAAQTLRAYDKDFSLVIRSCKWRPNRNWVQICTAVYQLSMQCFWLVPHGMFHKSLVFSPYIKQVCIPGKYNWKVEYSMVHVYHEKAFHNYMYFIPCHRKWPTQSMQDNYAQRTMGRFDVIPFGVITAFLYSDRLQYYAMV